MEFLVGTIYRSGDYCKPINTDSDQVIDNAAAAGSIFESIGPPYQS